MTLLYLRYRARMVWRALRPASRRDWGALGLAALLLVANAPMLVLLYAGLHTLCTHVAATRGLAAVQRLLYLPATAHSVLLVVLALNRVYPVLLESADSAFIRSLPLAGGRVATARLTQLTLLLAPVGALLAPLVYFYASAAAAGPLMSLWIVLLLAMLLAFLVGSTCLLVAALARALPAGGLRRLARYGTLVLLLPVALGMSLVSQFQGLPARLAGQVDALLAYGDRLAWSPGAWVVKGVGAAAAGATGTACAWLLALTAGAVVTWVAARAVAAPLLQTDLAETTPEETAAGRGTRSWAPARLRGASRALWRREFGAVLVEAPRALLALLPLAFFIVVPRLTGPSPMTQVLPYMLVFMGTVMVSSLCLSSVGQEGEAFWLLRVLPLPMWRVLAVKLVVRLASAALVLVPCALLVAFTVPRSAWPVQGRELAVGAAVLFVALGVAGAWGLATGARFPRFKPARKGQYVSVAASLCAVYGSSFIVATSLLSLLPLKVPALRPLLWFLPLATLAFWAAVALLFLAWAAWHLETIEA